MFSPFERTRSRNVPIGCTRTNDENTRSIHDNAPGGAFVAARDPRHKLVPAPDVDVARDHVRVRHRVGVRDDAAVPRRGVARAMRGVRSRHGDDWATGVAGWIQWSRSARVGVGVVVVVDGDE